MQTLNWKHKPGAVGSHEIRVREAKFGDGYAQTVRDGINNVIASWPIVFEGGIGEIQPIYDFFVSHGGADSFLWKPPGAASAKMFKCRRFSMTSIGGGVYSLSAELTQSFAP